MAKRTKIGCPLNPVMLEGFVVTGGGSGKKFVQLPWVRQQIKEKLGFSPYFGTLNLRLTPESIELRRSLLKAKAFTITPLEGYCVGLLFPAFIGRTDCGIVLPQVEGYPQDTLEIVSAINLRDALHLNDGNKLAVSVLV